MKTSILGLLLLATICSYAQFKLPSGKSIEKKLEKKVEKVLENATDGKDESDGSKTAIPAEETSSPAKSQINSFWKHIEKMRSHTKDDNKQVVYSNGIQSAQTALNNTKTKDPAYATADMEKALQECKAVYNSLGSAKESGRQANIASGEAAGLLFGKPYIFEKAQLNAGGDSAESRTYMSSLLVASDAALLEYKTKVDDFLASNPHQATYQNYQSSVKAKSSAVHYAIKNAVETQKTARNVANLRALQDLYIYQVFLESAIKVYPQELSLEPNLQLINTAIQKFGTRETYMDSLEANQLRFVKNLRMGKAVVSNPALEKLAKQQFEAAEMNTKSYTVTKVNLTSEWRLTKNELGIPLHKEIYASFAIKFSDGTCGLATGYMNQAYEGGGSYGAAQLHNPSNIQALPCENLNK